jgi:WD40 repeat protein
LALIVGLIVGWLLVQSPAEASDSEQPVDPMRLILQRASEAMDESYDSWNFRPEETVDSTTFTINYIASLSTDGQKRLDRVMILHVDPNRDRMVTRDEALRFLETQLGIRWVTGDRLRFDDGRVVAFAGFLRADTDQNDEISEQEFVVAVWDRDGAKADFAAMDANGNGAVTLTEYASPNGPNVRNMIELFERADVDGDGGLSERELLQVTPVNRRHLVRSNLVAFDDDADQLLSLTEFRISMLGNLNYPWEMLPQDENHDDAISFDEFQFHPRDLFQLQKRYYFHRLDGNGDDQLTIDEFDFEQQKSYSLYRISRGGEEVKEVYQSDRFPTVGAPSVSQDGQSILLHAIPPQGEHKALVVIMSADGNETREICHGLMPSWAPASGRFACSRYEGGAGVWIMRTDGNAERRIDDGWGAQWSPDGRSIAYTNDNSIRVYDLASGQSRIVLAKQEHPYRYVHPHLAWSPDSRRIAFYGNLDREVEIGVLDISRGNELNQRFRTVDALTHDLTWMQDGKRLLFSMHSPRYGRSLIYQLQVDTRDPPKIFPDSGTGMSWEDVCSSPSGRYIVATSGQ